MIMIELGTAINISVQSLFDAIVARKRVRELAQSMGFNLAEQASVSLAAWSLLGHLGIGSTCQGEIAADPINDGPNKGMRITCTTEKNANSNTSDIRKKMCLFVNELKIDVESANQINVSFVMWKQ